jgi:DNA (cytosine-5)-methyltransferase 1
MTPQVAEFFAGIGLMRMGLERAGWEVVFANDICAKKQAMYETHFGREGHFHPGDIHQLEVSRMPPVALATASFPCTDLSNAGGRAGLSGRQSSAYWGFIEVLKRLGDKRPPIVLLENVFGFLTSNGGEDFRVAMESLNALGYVVDPFVINAERYVPQSRERLFVVAHLRSPNVTDPLVREERVFFQDELRPRKLADFILRHPLIHWDLRKLPLLPRRTLNLDSIIESLPPGDPAWWSEQRAAYLLGQMGPSHRSAAEKMIASDRVSYGTVFRRMRQGRSTAEMRCDGIAGCLRTPKGGSARQILFVAGRGRYRARLLTARESARLMGADDFRIECPLNQALFGFGDAVCVPVVEWIATHYLNPLRAEISARNLAA